MLAALERFGTTAVPMHLALFNIPLTFAVRYEVPLVVWGENSAVEYVRRAAEPLDVVPARRAWVRRYGVTARHDRRRLGLGRADPRRPDAVLRAHRRRARGSGARVSSATTSAGTRSEPRGRARARLPRERHGPEDRLLRLRRHRRRLHLDPPLAQVAEVRLHAHVRQPRRSRSATAASRAMRRSSIAARARRRAPHADIDAFCDYVGIERARFYEIAERFRNPDDLDPARTARGRSRASCSPTGPGRRRSRRTAA